MGNFNIASKVLDRKSDIVKDALNKIKAKDMDSRLERLAEAKERLWTENVPVIRTDDRSLVGILGDGRFKNYLETGHTNGGEGNGSGIHRRLTESANFGKYTNDSDRPIYGYMEHPYTKNPSVAEKEGRLGSDLTMYGNVKFYPKRDFTRKTSTFTLGDSEFDGNYPLRWDAEDWQAFARKSEADNPKSKMYIYPNDRTAIRLNSAADKDWFDNNAWAELQFHDGVSLDDIASVTIPENIRSKIRNQAIEAANRYGFRLDEEDLNEIVKRCLANCLE